MRAPSSELTEGHELLLPPPPNGHPTGRGLMCDTSLGRSYITTAMVACNSGRLSEWQLRGPSQYLLGYDGQRHYFSSVLRHVRIFFMNNDGSVAATRDLDKVPVVDKGRITNPTHDGWAGSLGADVLDWGLASIHEEAPWFYGVGGYHDCLVGAWCLQPPDASIDILLATTAISRRPIGPEHPRVSQTSRLDHQRAVGIHIVHSGLPYIVGMPSVLGAFRIWTNGSRETEPFTIWDDGDQLTRTYSPLRSFKDWSDGGLLPAHQGRAEKFKRAMLMRLHTANMRRYLRLLNNPTPSPLPSVTFEGALLGWWDGGIRSMGGEAYTCADRVTMFAIDRPNAVGQATPTVLTLMPLQPDGTRLPHRWPTPATWPSWFTEEQWPANAEPGDPWAEDMVQDLALNE